MAATSPMAYVSGRPGTVRSEPTGTRPARPVGSCSVAASGLAFTPAAQISVWQASSSPSAKRTAVASTSSTCVAQPYLDPALLQRRERIAAATSG